MPPQISLHIGAHKTATTHLQRSLAAQPAELAAVGTRFFGPPTFRKGPDIATRFGLEGSDNTAEAAQATLSQMAGQSSRVIISEENFIGTLHNRFAKIAMPLYPQAAPNLTRLADQIAPDGLDVFLGIRNPAAYISSAYCQALIGGHKVVLDEVKAQNPIEGVDWAELVDRIAKLDGVRSLTVWRYEDYKALFSDIVMHLAGGEVSLTPLDSIVHPGLSTEAVARILLRYADGKGRKAAVRARDRYPVGPAHPPFDAFDADAHAVAAARYRAQVAAIDAMDDVTLLKA